MKAIYQFHTFPRLHRQLPESLQSLCCFDGFILSHTYEPVDIPSQEEVDGFLPSFNPYQRLDAKNPISMGMYATPDYYHEFRYELDQAMIRAGDALKKYGAEFADHFGRDYSSPLELYRMDDADIAVVALGSVCGTIKDSIDEMRESGQKVGLVKIRTYRPFPRKEIISALNGVSGVAVIEKNMSPGSAMKGAVGLEVKEALDNMGVHIYSYVTGLGGRDIRKKDIKSIVSLAGEGKGDMFYGLREELL